MPLRKIPFLPVLNKLYADRFLRFILGLITIIGGLYLISQGKDIQGYRLLIGTAATLVSVFIYGKHQNKKERIEKACLNPEKINKIEFVIFFCTNILFMQRLISYFISARAARTTIYFP